MADKNTMITGVIDASGLRQTWFSPQLICSLRERPNRDAWQLIFERCRFQPPCGVMVEHLHDHLRCQVALPVTTFFPQQHQRLNLNPAGRHEPSVSDGSNINCTKYENGYLMSLDSFHITHGTRNGTCNGHQRPSESTAKTIPLGLRGGEPLVSKGYEPGHYCKKIPAATTTSTFHSVLHQPVASWCHLERVAQARPYNNQCIRPK